MSCFKVPALNVSNIAGPSQLGPPQLQTQLSGGPSPGAQEMGDAYKVSSCQYN